MQFRGQRFHSTDFRIHSLSVVLGVFSLISAVAGSASAVPINSIGGGWFGASPGPSNVPVSSFDFIGLAGFPGFELPISVVSPSVLAPNATTAALHIDLAGFTGVLNTSSGPLTSIGQLTIHVGADKAVFDLSNISLTQTFNFSSPPSGVIYANMTLSQTDTTSAIYSSPDLNGFKAFGSGLLAITYNGILVTTDGTNGHALIGTGASASYTAVDAPVPEPAMATLATSGVLAFAGFGVMRRWRRNR